jgi:hypothetical protein
MAWTAYPERRLKPRGMALQAHAIMRRARFENPSAPGTIGSDLIPSLSSQSLTDKPETVEVPIKTDGTR